MDEQAQRLIQLRRHHPAWMLLASTNGPLMAASMKSLIDAHPAGIELESAVEHLALAMADYANDTQFDIGEDHALSARRELRSWIRRGLIVERGGELLATDALQKVCDFVDSLSDETMTSATHGFPKRQWRRKGIDGQPYPDGFAQLCPLPRRSVAAFVRDRRFG